MFVTISSYIPLTIVVTEWRGKQRKQMNQLDNLKEGRATDMLLNYETVEYFCSEQLELDAYGSSISSYQVSASSSPGMCTVLYCTVLYCTVLYCTVLYCTVLYCTALYCTVLHCTALHCTALHCTVLHCTALYCTALHCTVLYCTALHCTVLYCSKLLGQA